RVSLLRTTQFNDAVGRSSIALATSATPTQSAFRGRNCTTKPSPREPAHQMIHHSPLSPLYEQPINESQLIPDDDYATNDNSIDAADITMVSLIAVRVRDPIFQTSGSRVDCRQSRVRVQQVRSRQRVHQLAADHQFSSINWYPQYK
uniref:Kinesin motor domain-containing protein n=1 Tax=Macrostomum lignano TaxID=282301 RepID=A0A1I8FMD9_9PLAT